MVESAPRRGMSRSTPAPISPTSGAPGPPRGMPMSITSTSPAYSLPGPDPQPELGAVERRRGDARGPPAPATSPVDASTPDGTSAATTGASAASISSITLPPGSRGAPVRAGAEQRVDDHVRLVEPPGLERDRRRRRAAASAAPAASPCRHSGGHTASTSTSRPAAAQQPRGDEPVAAVVALAADDRDPAGGRALRDHARRAPPPRAPSAPATGCPSSRSPTRRSRASPRPSSSGSIQRGRLIAVTATAAAMPCVCVSETDDRRRRARAARSLGRAGQAHRRRLVTPADDLDVAPAPLAQLQRLRDRLLGAEARGEVHDRAARAWPRTRARRR